MKPEILDIAGIRIVKPFEKLCTKFGFDRDSDYVPFGLYDGYHTPAERRQDPDVLELEDLLVTVAMNSRVGASTATAFWKGIQARETWYVKCTNLLGQIPPELHLADAGDEELAHINQLFDKMQTVKGIKIAVAAKILCRKRPRSIPMLDSNVLPLACHLSMENDGDTKLTGPPWAPWRDIGRALRFFQNACIVGRQPLEGLCKSFLNLSGSPNITPLRAFESLLWWELWQKQDRDPRIQKFREFWGWVDES